MIEKYLDLKNGKVIEIEVFEGKGRRVYENKNNIISKEKYKEINKDCPEIDEIISAYISDKNLKVKMPDDSEKWNLDEVKEYFIENEIYIQFYEYYRRTNIVKKSRFFISEVEEVKDRDGEVQENEFILYARLEIDGEIVRLKDYMTKNNLNLLNIFVKEKDVENEYY